MSPGRSDLLGATDPQQPVPESQASGNTWAFTRDSVPGLSAPSRQEYEPAPASIDPLTAPRSRPQEQPGPEAGAPPVEERAQEWPSHDTKDAPEEADAAPAEWFDPEDREEPSPGSRWPRARRGRDPIAEDFPEFDERPSDTEGYPGYESLSFLPETANRAKAVLAAGILALLLFPIGVLPGALALLLAPGARRQIRRSRGELEGRGLVGIGSALACAGIVLNLVTAVVAAGVLLL